MMTIAVAVHTMMVSMNGPIEATYPSLMGWFVLTAACAIEADPNPASFENTARRIPHINALPTVPPAIADP